MKSIVIFLLVVMSLGLVLSIPNEGQNTLDFDYPMASGGYTNITNLTQYINTFDQNLNTTSDVTFDSITIGGWNIYQDINGTLVFQKT